MARPSRAYNSRVRSLQAEATRRSILIAARRLFAKTGYQATTVEAIAAAAEVSVATVYATFRSKNGILAELVEGAVADPSIRRIAKETEGETRPEQRLRKAAHVMRLALEAEAELSDVLWQAGSGNSELLAAWRQMHQNRHRRLSEVFAPLIGRAKLRRLLDVVWAFGSPEVYRLLVGERGWTPDQFEAWLAESLVNFYGGTP